MMKQIIFNCSTFLEYLNDGNKINSIEWNNLVWRCIHHINREKVISSLNGQEREAKNIPIIGISIDDRYK